MASHVDTHSSALAQHVRSCTQASRICILTRDADTEFLHRRNLTLPHSTTLQGKNLKLCNVPEGPYA